LNKIFKNVFYLGSSDIISRFLNFIAVIYLARSFGPKEMGLIAASISILTIGNILAELGLPILGTKIISRSSKNFSGFLKKILTLRLYLSIIIFLIILIILRIYFFESDFYYLSIIYLLALFPASFLMEWVFQGFQNFKIISKGRILSTSIYLIWIILFINKESDLIFIPIGWILSIFFQSFYLGIINFKFLKIEYGKTNFSKYQILKKALPLALSTIIAQLIIQFPPIFLGFNDSFQGGLFNVSFRLIVFLLMLNRIFYSLFFPKITKLINENDKIFKKYFTIVLKLIVFLSMYIGIISIQLSNNFFTFIFGDNYQDSSEIFQILCFYFIFSLINSVFTFTLIGLDKENIYLKSLIIGALGFILFFLLTEYTLAIRFSICLVIFQIISLGIMSVELMKTIKFNYLSSIFFPLILLFIMVFLKNVLNSYNSNFLFLINMIVFPLILFYILNISSSDKKFLMNNLK